MSSVGVKFIMSGVGHFFLSMSAVGLKILAMWGVGITPFMGPFRSNILSINVNLIYTTTAYPMAHLRQVNSQQKYVKLISVG